MKTLVSQTTDLGRKNFSSIFWSRKAPKTKRNWNPEKSSNWTTFYFLVGSFRSQKISLWEPTWFQNLIIHIWASFHFFKGNFWKLLESLVQVEYWTPKRCSSWAPLSNFEPFSIKTLFIVKRGYIKSRTSPAIKFN